MYVDEGCRGTMVNRLFKRPRTKFHHEVAIDASENKRYVDIPSECVSVLTTCPLFIIEAAKWKPF
jgi:hypothetical protein